jgi:hypothetical protein
VIKLNELLAMYQSMIEGMRLHIKSCKKSHCCIRLVGENVVLGNYQGYISTDSPSKEIMQKKEMAQTLDAESQSRHVGGKTP